MKTNKIVINKLFLIFSSFLPHLSMFVGNPLDNIKEYLYNKWNLAKIHEKEGIHIIWDTHP